MYVLFLKDISEKHNIKIMTDSKKELIKRLSTYFLF